MKSEQASDEGEKEREDEEEERAVLPAPHGGMTA